MMVEVMKMMLLPSAGTGSGLGTRVLGLLEEEFPDVCRIVTAVYPSADDDDVITSPYNSVLAMGELTEHADCVLPVENQVSLQILYAFFFFFLGQIIFVFNRLHSHWWTL